MKKQRDWLDREHLANRPKNCLRAAGYENKDQVWHDFQHNRKKLAMMPQLGDWSMGQIEKWLRNYEPKQYYAPNVVGAFVPLPPNQGDLFAQPSQDAFDMMAEWVEKVGMTLDANTAMLRDLHTRITHLEEMLSTNRKIREFEAMLKSWEK